MYNIIIYMYYSIYLLINTMEQLKHYISFIKNYIIFKKEYIYTETVDNRVYNR